MNETLLGKLDENEIQTLSTISQRKTALEELVKIIPEKNDALYEKIIKDYSSTQESLVSWWEQVAQHHNWKYRSTDSWRVDFNTCEIFLRHQS